MPALSEIFETPIVDLSGIGSFDSLLVSPVQNKFCPTGKGGGVDPHCGESETGSSSHRGSTYEIRKARAMARDKVMMAPVPSQEDIRKARAELAAAARGEGRPGGESRGGSAASRRQQRLNLFKEFGGQQKGYIVCHGCGLKCHHSDDKADNPNGYARFERGKIFIKKQGGGYQLKNLLPECFGCNRSRNDTPIRKENLS